MHTTNWTNLKWLCWAKGVRLKMSYIMWFYLYSTQKHKTVEMKPEQCLQGARSGGQVYEGVSWEWWKCFVSRLWCWLFEYLSPTTPSIHPSIHVKIHKTEPSKNPFYFRLTLKIKIHFKISLLLLWFCPVCTLLLWSKYPMMGLLSRDLKLLSQKLELILGNHNK